MAPSWGARRLSPVGTVKEGRSFTTTIACVFAELIGCVPVCPHERKRSLGWNASSLHSLLDKKRGREGERERVRERKGERVGKGKGKGERERIQFNSAFQQCGNSRTCFTLVVLNWGALRARKRGGAV